MVKGTIYVSILRYARPYSDSAFGESVRALTDVQCQRVHFAAYLNDNGDGTFTIKGYYQSKHRGIGKGGKILIKAPAIVISKEPLAGDDWTPIPKPELPHYLVSRSQDEDEDQGTLSRSSRLDSLRPRRTSSRTEGAEAGGDDVSAKTETLVNGRHPLSVGTRDIKDPASTLQQPQPSSLISCGTLQSPGDILEMEDWEVAPGRIRDTSTPDAESKCAPFPSRDWGRCKLI